MRASRAESPPPWRRPRSSVGQPRASCIGISEVSVTSSRETALSSEKFPTASRTSDAMCAGSPSDAPRSLQSVRMYVPPPHVMRAVLRCRLLARRKAQHLQTVNMHRARLPLDRDSLAGEVVESLAVVVERRDHRRHLLNLAQKTREARPEESFFGQPGGVGFTPSLPRLRPRSSSRGQTHRRRDRPSAPGSDAAEAASPARPRRPERLSRPGRAFRRDRRASCAKSAASSRPRRDSSTRRAWRHLEIHPQAAILSSPDLRNHDQRNSNDRR